MGEVADEFLDFLADAPLVAHNAISILAFSIPSSGLAQAAAVSARSPRRHTDACAAQASRRVRTGSTISACGTGSTAPGAATKHGALLDAELLAEVYIELIDARQTTLGLVANGARGVFVGRAGTGVRTRPAPLSPRISEEERVAHAAFIATLGDAAVWRSYAS